MNNEIKISVLGPGLWMKLHNDARRAITDERKRVFEYNVEEDCNNFPCAKCKTHFRTFLNNNPLKKYWHITDNKGRDIGFFKWTWELHNRVNKYLHKYEPTFEEAYNYYAEGLTNTCFNCDVQQREEEVQQLRSMPIPAILTNYLETKQRTAIDNNNTHRRSNKNIITRVTK